MHVLATELASLDEADQAVDLGQSPADLVVLSQDLFRLDPRRIHETKVLLTIFDGRVVHTYPGIDLDAVKSPDPARR